jgi:RHS repeat-associated protein
VSDAGAAGPAIRYDPYGGIRTGTASSSGIGFNGEMSDLTGLLNLRARAYDPALGRFLSQDSFGGWAAVPASANRYAYGLGNPLRYADPSGHTASAIVNWAVSNPGEAAQFVVAFAFARFWGATAVVSGIVGFDVWTGRTLSDGERLAYAALGNLPTGLEADVGRLGEGASRIEGVAGEARLSGRSALGSLEREATALRAGEAAGIRSADTVADGLRLSTHRFTAPGETFVRYESSAPAYSRVTELGGVSPGTYATPLTDGIASVELRPTIYNLPSPNIPRTETIVLSPPAGTTIIGPRPVVGGSGNEVLFPFGFPWAP